MSTDFTLKAPPEDHSFGTDLANMSNKRADGLYALTKLVGQHYGLPSGIADREHSLLQDYDVSEDEFCALVEAVFADPVDLLSGWARYAAGMYDMAKGVRHNWGWGADLTLKVSFAHVHYCVRAPTQASDRWVGSRQEEEGNDFTFQVGDTVAYRMGRRRAELFIALAEFAIGEVNAMSTIVNAVRIETGTGLVRVSDEACQVEGEAFCLLVEQVVFYSFDWLCPWAQVAAAMYETIKGKWFNWIWEPRSSPTYGFIPIRQPELAPQEPSGKTIAWKDWGFWEERARQGNV